MGEPLLTVSELSPANEALFSSVAQTMAPRKKERRFNNKRFDFPRALFFSVPKI